MSGKHHAPDEADDEVFGYLVGYERPGSTRRIWNADVIEDLEAAREYLRGIRDRGYERSDARAAKLYALVEVPPPVCGARSSGDSTCSRPPGHVGLHEARAAIGSGSVHWPTLCDAFCEISSLTRGNREVLCSLAADHAGAHLAIFDSGAHRWPQR